MEKRSRKPVAARTASSPNAASSSANAIPSSSSNQPYTDVPDGANDDGDLPPSYSGPSPSSSSLPLVSRVYSSLPTIPGMPPVEFGLYRIPGATVSKDLLTTTTSHPQYSSSAPSLLNLLQTQSKLPPHPQIRITGKRDGHGTDFDIKISMMRYIARSPDSRGSGWNYVKFIGPSEMGWRGGKHESRMPDAKGLEDWVNRYVAEESKDKSFTLKKQVTNWNTDYLEGQIRNLVASTNYKGKLTVTFPVTHSNLVVQSPSNKAWYQAIAAAFQPSQVRRYEVVTAVWPYAALAPDDASGQGNSWAVKSEMQFWKEWAEVLKYAVLEKRVGWVTLEDHIEFAMSAGWQGKKQTRDWDWDQPGNGGS